jgi:hypothetical protein
LPVFAATLFDFNGVRSSTTRWCIWPRFATYSGRRHEVDEATY